jgi:uncharacterized phage protein (TIGR02218 family)
MKNASASTVAILSSGRWTLAELYDFTLASGQVYHFTNFDVPLLASIYWPAAGPFTYRTGLTIKRGAKTQKAGTDGGSMKLTISPQADSPQAPVLINGYPFLKACRLGFFDNATIQLSKLFMNQPTATRGVDPSPGAVGDFKGVAQDVQAGRLSAEITVDNYLALLGNQQMPRQLFGVGCWHQVYDAGCTLLKAAFTSTARVTAVTDGAHFNTSLAALDAYFQLGVIQFLTGPNAGFSANVANSFNAGGAIVTRYPFPIAPNVGDQFTIYPGCDLQESTCINKFNNLAHFGGQPYVPVPETIIDGGTNAPPAQVAGAQAGQLIGSLPSGTGGYGPYKT